MADVEVLRGLRTRVEEASGADRSLDARICQVLAIEPWTGWWATQSTAIAAYSALDRDTPHLTGSVDAVLALMERVLPGWDAHFYHDEGQYVAEMTWPNGTDIGEADYFGITGRAPTRPLAILCGVVDGCVQVACAAAETKARRAALLAQAEGGADVE